MTSENISHHITKHTTGKNRVTKFHVEQVVKKTKNMTFKQLQGCQNGEKAYDDYVSDVMKKTNVDISNDKNFKLCASSKNNKQKCKQTKRRPRGNRQPTKKSSKSSTFKNASTSMTPKALMTPSANNMSNNGSNNLALSIANIFSKSSSPVMKDTPTPKKTPKKSNNKTKKRASSTQRQTRSSTRGAMTRSRSRTQPNYRT